MYQGLIYIIIVCGCIYLLLDEFVGNKRITSLVERMFQE